MTAIIVVVLLAALALLLGYAATRPDRFCIQRTTVIKAPADKVFALINDLKSFNNWNPFEKKDPGIQGSYSGAARGVGAAYAWQGRKAGSGWMEITQAEPSRRITMRLDFVKPMAAQNTAEFTLQPEGDALTIVTWAMHGPAPFRHKLIGVIFNIDSMIGKDFEAGLANLRSLAEARPPAA